MDPIMIVEFSAKTNAADIKEESVSLHNPEELFAFVAPGGGCEKISCEVCEVQMVFLNQHTPISRILLQINV